MSVLKSTASLAFEGMIQLRVDLLVPLDLGVTQSRSHLFVPRDPRPCAPG